MKAKLWLAIAVIGLLVLFAVFSTSTPPGSRLPEKSFRAANQMQAIQNFADYHREDLLKLDRLENEKFVQITGLTGSVFKFDEKGEVLDPWGLPYVFGKANGQVTVMSPGLEEYKKLPWYKRIFQ